MKQIKQHTLYRKVDKTTYEINVKQSGSARDSVEDILVRLIATDSMSLKENDNG